MCAIRALLRSVQNADKQYSVVSLPLLCGCTRYVYLHIHIHAGTGEERDREMSHSLPCCCCCCCCCCSCCCVALAYRRFHPVPSLDPTYPLQHFHDYMVSCVIAVLL